MIIGICDDEETAFVLLKGMMEKILKEQNVKAEIVYFNSGEKLLAQADKLAVIFLDIYMPGMDGIETGRRLKRVNPDCKVIMATGAEDLYKEGYKIGAYRFMTKPFQKEELQEVIESLIYDGILSGEITVYQNRTLYHISINDIYYVRSMNDAVELVCQEGVYRKRGTLDRMEELLDGRFYRISRGNIVNMHKIAEYQDGIVTIYDTELKVAVRRKTKFEHAFSSIKYS